MNSLGDRARERWAELAGGGARFAADLSVAVSPGSRLCPPGWVGIVVIDGAVLATAPDEGAARRLQRALGGLGAETLTGGGVLRERLAVGDLRGPRRWRIWVRPTSARRRAWLSRWSWVIPG